MRSAAPEVLHEDLGLVAGESVAALVLTFHIAALPALFLRFRTLLLQRLVEAQPLPAPARVLRVEFRVVADAPERGLELAGVVSRIGEQAGDRLVLFEGDFEVL